jgi:hypothetical protein
MVVVVDCRTFMGSSSAPYYRPNRGVSLYSSCAVGRLAIYVYLVSNIASLEKDKEMSNAKQKL